MTSIDEICLSSFAYTVTIRFDEFERNKYHVRSFMVVRKKMFRDCSRFRTGCLFVNCSAVLVKTVFKSSFCFSYVLFLAAVAMYHVNNGFRVAVYMMSDKSRFVGRMKCVTGTSVRPLCSCMSNSCLHIEKNHGVGYYVLPEGNKRCCFEDVGASGR